MGTPWQTGVGVFRLTLACNVVFNIAKEKTMADLMAALSNMYKKHSASNKVYQAKIVQSENGRRCFSCWSTERVQHCHNSIDLCINRIWWWDQGVDFVVFSTRKLERYRNSSEQFFRAFKTTVWPARDLILSEEICRRELGEISRPGSTLNTKARGRTSERLRSF